MKWKAKIIRHRGEDRIAVRTENPKDNYKVPHLFDDASWSQTKKVWLLPNDPEYRKFFGLESDAATIAEIQRFRRWLLSKRYSENTIETYCDAVSVFLNFMDGKHVRQITEDDILIFNTEYILKKKLSASYQNQLVSAIKLFFLTVDKRKIEIANVHRPKRAKQLPNVLSKGEVKLILEAHANIKHRTMLSLIYSCGLRRSELLNLKPADIDSDAISL